MIKKLLSIFKKAYFSIELKDNEVMVLHNRDNYLVLEIMEDANSGIYPYNTPKYEIIGEKEDFEEGAEALIFYKDGRIHFAYDTWDGYQPFSD